MPYDGRITDGSEHAACCGYNMNTVTWKRWSGRNFEYNEGQKYAGNGILIRMVGKRKFFHLSTYPNEDAFTELSERMEGRATTGGSGNLAYQRCECGKTFKPFIGQDCCARCLLRQKTDVEMEKKNLETDAENHRKKVELLSQELMALQSDYDFTKSKAAEIDNQWKMQQLLLDAEKAKSKSLYKKIASLKDGCTKHRSLSRLTKELTHCLALNSDALSNVLSGEQKIKGEVANLKIQLDSYRSELAAVIAKQQLLTTEGNTSIITFLQETIYEDSVRFFTGVFGVSGPLNKNIRKNCVEKNLREFPKQFHGILASSGFSNMSFSFRPGETLESDFAIKVQDLLNFGCYINEESETVSVGHLRVGDIFDLVGRKDILQPGEIQHSDRIDTESLQQWRRISRKRLASKVIEHLFKINFLTKYKRITAARIRLEETTYGVMLIIEVTMASYRKIGQRMVRDIGLETWQSLF
jgi:hypothetical protein